MQTTLLGAAIAIILVLVTALVGPLFVDWGRFRETFEAKAQRLTGLEVKVAGPIEVRILPTPSLKLQDIEARRPGEDMPIKARSMQIEFALDALMRGGLRVVNLAVEGPQIAVGLDASGRFAWPAPTIGFDADALSIDRLVIDDGQIALSDARSGASATLEKVTFRGDLRSVVGPAKGDGAFVLGGQAYPYRLSTSRPAADGAVKLRLAVDSAEQPRMAEIDGSVWIERGVPQFDATVQWAHGLGRSSAGSGEAWRLNGHLRGSSTAVAADKVEVQYGPEERAARLHGDANLTLGQKPELSAMLSATQIDLDRVFGLPESVRRKPLAVLRSLGDRFSGLQQSPVPVRLSIGVDGVTLAGGALQRVSAELHGEAGHWSLDALTFRAPGATQARLAGRLDVGPQGVDFTGPARIDAKDPRALVAWLTDHADAQLAAASFRAEGEVRLGTETFAIDRLKADLDRMSLEGRFAYKWPAGGRPARVEAALSAPDVDFDRTYTLIQDMFAGSFGGDAFAWPREGTLALNVAHSSVAGVAVQGADVDLRFDARTLGIERLAIADFGGATVAAKGNIDISARTPRGSVTLDLDIRTPDGILALLDKAAPEAARELRRAPARFIPAKLAGSLAVDTAGPLATAPPSAPMPAAGASSPRARFKIGGTAGTFAFDLEGEAGAAGDAVSFSDLARLDAARLDVTGHLSAQDGSALTDITGLDRLVLAGKGAGRIDFKAAGALNDPMKVEGRMRAGGLDVSADGALRLPLGRSIAATLVLAVAKANLRTLRAPVSAAGTVRVEVSDDVVSLSELSGRISGTDVTGRLAVGLAHPATLDGDLRLGKADLPALVAAVVGMPDRSGAGSVGPSTSLSSEPFGPGLFAGAVGRIAVAAANAELTPRLAARELHGSVEVAPGKVILRDFAAGLAGGTVSGRLELQHGPDGVAATGNLNLRDVEMAALMPGDGALSGRLALEATVNGSGRSLLALMGSLRGNGTFAAEHAAIARLDPSAFNPLVRSVDDGMPIETSRVVERLESALAGGAFEIPQAQGTFAVTGGVIRLIDSVSGQGTDLALTAHIDLGTRAMDANLTLTGPAGLGPPDHGRPIFEIALQGPVDDPKRVFDVATLTNWLSSRAIALNAQRLEAAEAARAAPPREQARLEALARADALARAEQARAEQARAEQARAEKARAEQAKAEQAKAEQAKAEQARAEQARAEQARAEQARAEQARAEQARAEQARAEQARAEQARAEQARAEQARAEQARAEQARAEAARAEQARAERAKADQARAEQARAEQARAEQARAEQARAEQARAEQARAEAARAEQARAEQAKAEQARAEQARAEQAKAEQARAEQARAEQARAEQVRAEAARAEQARAEKAKADQARAEQAKAEQARAEQAREEQARAEQLRAEQARAEQARAEQARAEQARAEKAKADQARAEKAKADQARAERARAEALAMAEPGKSADPGPRQGTSADPAIRALDQAIVGNPNDANAFSRRGQLLVLRGEFSYAIRDFDEVLRIRPKDPEALNNRCWARAILGELQIALHDCNEALAIRPSYADALDSRGFVNLKIGQPTSAVADYDAALRLNPRQASSLYGRGVAKLKTGKAADGQRDIAAAKALQANIADEFANLGIR